MIFLIPSLDLDLSSLWWLKIRERATKWNRVIIKYMLDKACCKLLMKKQPTSCKSIAFYWSRHFFIVFLGLCWKVTITNCFSNLNMTLDQNSVWLGYSNSNQDIQILSCFLIYFYICIKYQQLVLKKILGWTQGSKI